MRREQEKSDAVAAALADQFCADGLTVAGSAATIEALQRDQVDLLVLAEGYRAEPGLCCETCGLIHARQDKTTTCSTCGSSDLRDLDMREEMVRLAIQYGNLNSSFIGPAHAPMVRLPGTGGGNDIASLAKMIVAMPHEKRRFVNQVDFVTSPGFLTGGTSRKEAGLIAGGMYRVVTDLAMLGFDTATGRMQIEALHPGVTAEQVRASTGFELMMGPSTGCTETPSEAELAALRRLDPDRVYTA